MGFSTWIVKKQKNWFQEPKDRTFLPLTQPHCTELSSVCFPCAACWWPAIWNWSATDSAVHLPPGLSAPLHHGCPMSRLLFSSWMFRIMRETARLLHDVNCSFWQNASLRLLEKGKIMIIPFTSVYTMPNTLARNVCTISFNPHNHQRKWASTAVKPKNKWGT